MVTPKVACDVDETIRRRKPYKIGIVLAALLVIFIVVGLCSSPNVVEFSQVTVNDNDAQLFGKPSFRCSYVDRGPCELSICRAREGMSAPEDEGFYSTFSWWHVLDWILSNGVEVETGASLDGCLNASADAKILVKPGKQYTIGNCRPLACVQYRDRFGRKVTIYLRRGRITDR